MDVTISRLARALGCSVQTLRRWEREGKVPPAHRLPLTRERYWTEQEADEMRRLFGTDTTPSPSGLESLAAAFQGLAPMIARQVKEVLGRETAGSLSKKE